MELERRFIEIRQSGGRVIEGAALVYTDESRQPWGNERFSPQPFGDLSMADVVLDVHHDRSAPLARTGGGGLELIDSPEALSIRAEIPDTQLGNDTLTMIRRGVLRGLSIAFRALRERFEGGTRIVTSARLSRVSIVDSPAYPRSLVEARRAALETILQPRRRKLWL